MRIPERLPIPGLLLCAVALGVTGLVLAQTPSGQMLPVEPALPGELMRQTANPEPSADCALVWRQTEEGLRKAGRDPHELDARGVETSRVRCPPRVSPAAEVPPQPIQAPAAIEPGPCEFALDILSDPAQGYMGWDTPAPVLLARQYESLCAGHTPKPTPVERIVLDALRQFGSGDYTGSGDSFARAVDQEADATVRQRYRLERARALVAAGMAEPGRDELRQITAQSSLPVMLRVDAHSLLAQAAAGGGDHAAAIAEALSAIALLEQEYGMAQAPTLQALLGLQELEGEDAQKGIARLGALIDEREQVLSGMEMVGSLLASPMMQVMMQGMAMDQDEVRTGMKTMEQGSGDLLLPRFACTALSSVQIQRGDIGGALETVERCRGRVLNRLLANRAFHAAPAPPPLDFAALAAMAPSDREVRSHAKAQGINEEDARRQLTMQRLQGPGAAAGRPATVSDMRAMAREYEATIVVFAVDLEPAVLPGRLPDRERGVTAWVIGQDGDVAVRQQALDASFGEDARALSTAIAEAREGLGVQGRGGVARTATAAPAMGRADRVLRRFHAILIEPIEDLLPRRKASRLILVPEGPLLMLPFAALQDPAGKPLVERFSLSQVPSLQTLALASSRRRQGASVGEALVVGNPLMPEYRPDPSLPPVVMPPLPAAEEEARAVADITGTTALIGREASEVRVRGRIATARLVHLATHGVLDEVVAEHLRDVDPYARRFLSMGPDDDPVRTPGLLALAPGQGADGLLLADEIAESTTTADLVVMSACDTGLGSISDDGVIGLSRAWMAAGAASVLVSLWAIPDEPTRDLMVSFYRKLGRGAAKDAALREAMLEVRSDRPDPVNWAAFTIIGDPR